MDSEASECLDHTQFESIDLDRLCQGLTARGLPSSRTNQQEISREENSVIDNELRRINENLGNFTLVQFQDLRDRIREKGFQEDFEITQDNQ